VLGNLTDRVFRAPGFLRGHVVDFLQLPNWPIFNVADMCINVAAALIVLQAVRGVSIDGSRSRDSASDERSTGDQATEGRSAADPEAAP
jgi:signal peptidase II